MQTKSKYYGKYADKSDIPSTHKYCPRCDSVQARVDFFRDANNKDGLAGICKVCQCARSKAWQQANPERVAAARQRRKEEDPIGWREDQRLLAAKARVYQANRRALKRKQA
jgi:hypothetical protein